MPTVFKTKAFAAGVCAAQLSDYDNATGCWINAVDTNAGPELLSEYAEPVVPRLLDDPAYEIFWWLDTSAKGWITYPELVVAFRVVAAAACDLTVSSLSDGPLPGDDRAAAIDRVDGMCKEVMEEFGNAENGTLNEQQFLRFFQDCVPAETKVLIAVVVRQQVRANTRKQIRAQRTQERALVLRQEQQQQQQRDKARSAAALCAEATSRKNRQTQRKLQQAFV